MTLKDPLEWNESDDRRSPRADPASAFVVRLASYEGPIDLLLELARAQRVDLAEISILQLVDQFIAFVREANRLSLSLAADYLVMAAWLAYLKSRLLVPKQVEEGAHDPEDLAARLTFRLQQLSAMRTAADTLFQRPRLGLQRFSSPKAGAVEIHKKVSVQASLFELLKAYGAIQARRDARHRAVPKLEVPFTMEIAIQKLAGILPGIQDMRWTSLRSFLPPDLASPFERRSATASYFGAILELAKQGVVVLSQVGEHEEILLKPHDIGRLERLRATLVDTDDTEVWDLKGELDQAESQSEVSNEFDSSAG